MRVTTHQPIFMPWPGFFRKAGASDVMVLLDDVQFPQGRSWLSRNRLKNEQGELWLTVPAKRKGLGKQIIRDVEICHDIDWRRKHLLGIRCAYAHAPYLDQQLPALEALYAVRYPCLADLNIALIRHFWNALEVPGDFVLQSELGISGGKSELLVDLCRRLGAETYVTLPQAEKHLEPDRFKESGIDLRCIPFSPPVYPQLWGDFRYNLSVLDLLLNLGPKAKDLLT